MFGTANEDERDRLIAQAGVWDPVPRRRLARMRSHRGPLVLGGRAGSGTATRYLAERVGESGHVVAIDLETRWLQELEAPNERRR
jgi:ubiquinone/menaquinone biosynthesis C-methylase UbiE